MAEKVEAITVKINGVDTSLNSLKEVKKAIKELNSEALFGNKEAAHNVAELKEKLKGLGEETKTLQGSGIEKAESSFKLFGEGLKQMDFEKVKIGLAGLKGALAATGITIIIEAVSYLIEHFKELSEGSGVLAKVLRGVGDIIKWVTDKIYAITDAIGLTNSELDKMGEEGKKAAEKMTEALKEQSAEFDRQAKVAAASGHSTVQYEKAKQQAIIDTNMLIAKQIAAEVRAGLELDDDRKKRLTAAIESIKMASTEMKVIEIKDDADKKKKADDNYKKHLDNLKKQQDADKKAADDLFNELVKNQEAIEKQDADSKKQELKAEQDLFNDLAKIQDQADKDEADRKKKKVADDKKAADESVKLAQLTEQRKDAITKNSIAAAQGLSDAFFQTQLNGAKGNAQATLAIKKKMFEVDKAFNISKSIMDGIGLVTKTLSEGGPLAIPLAVTMGALAAANVAKIAATKFDDGGASGAIGSISAPNINGGGGGNVPLINNPQNAPVQPTTNFNSQGQNTSIKAYVVEGEISDAQNKAGKLKRLSSF